MWIANSPHIITSALVGCEEDLTEHVSMHLSVRLRRKESPPCPPHKTAKVRFKFASSSRESVWFGYIASARFTSVKASLNFPSLKAMRAAQRQSRRSGTAL